ncbi:peptide-methionine (S)-S-oxide reductase [Candidatus Kaiserbacteria bacterium RIFCSPHIGHO2_01_FULL_48_10]|uniref:Peptide methionine sulfoxide reductase MsrA n=1 Tax=Candidatus Kaiserbacteria bacterium RIFCSPHIGHO2_01_FULL_48_10 TaxID=1798476 RepID=A0A1F6C6H9_9BACT|nr:MAG: peptide-methionine (S)-S-oxide reductase [Candidatus Kaiserbacteria bacterium RIFCSPHIGHO2_01_FULL_48_10]HLD00038.1 peptide-methionine (S)-S-oxide reductase MsrA [Patescibacteria group bacterium]
MKNEIAVFGGGCFWCTEAAFERLRGIVSVESGYAGGNVENPTYEQVSGGRTGHAEVVRVEFDPLQISFHDLLTVFFGIHDPTTLNRQGNDSGTQYRSFILYTSDLQKQEVELYIAELQRDLKQTPIVTEIKKLAAFYPAEEYHKRYYERNSDQPYCQLVINPKIAKLKKEYAEFLKSAE